MYTMLWQVLSVFVSDEGSARHYIGLTFSLALQLNTTLLEACAKITELVPAPEPTNLSNSTDSGEDSSNDLSNSCHVSEVIEADSLREAGGDNGGAGESPDQRQLSGGQASVVSRDIPSSQTSPSRGLDLTGASPELLCALDLLSIILPSVRVWLDWMRIHKQLWIDCVIWNTESPIM